MKKEFGQAIKHLRLRVGLTQPELAEHIGVDKTNVSRYETGKQGMDFDRLILLAETLKVPLSDMFSMAETGNLSSAPDIKGTVPLISWIQAGHWNEVIDNLHLGEGERIATTYRKRKHTYALRVRGDSMEPKFPEGAILIVEPEESPEPGAFVIVRQNGGEATFKQLMVDGTTRYLKPLNPRYPIMELKADAVICGVVKRVEMDV